MILAAFVSVAQAQVRTRENTVLRFTKTYSSADGTLTVADTASDSLVVQTWSGAVDGVAFQVDVSRASGTIGAFKGYLYGSLTGNTFGTEKLDSIVITNTAARKAYTLSKLPTSYNFPYLKFVMQGAGSGTITVHGAWIIGKRK